MRRITTLLLLALSLCAASFAQTADEAKAIKKQIADYRTELNKEATAGGKQLTAESFAAMNQKVKAKYTELLKDTDPAKIDAKDAFEWAGLFQAAGRDKDACDLAKKYLTTNPSDAERFNAMYLMARSCNTLGEADMLAMTLNDIPVPTAANSSALTSMTTNQFVDTIYAKKGLGPALDTLDTVSKKIVLEDPKDYAKRMLDMMKAREATNPPAVAPKPDEERLKDLEKQGQTVNDSQVFAFVGKKADLYKEAGKQDVAIDLLKSSLAKMTPGTPAYRSANSKLIFMVLPGTPAPAIVSERSYGTFPGLEAMKGKVVIIDFFAHWCGPCIASFPDMEKMYSDLHDKGLEVVGVTTYYGYYRQEKNLSKDAEYAKMADFIAEYKLPWTVVYGERSNMDQYGITGIPTAILIDRQGKVHKLHVGYSAESFKEFRKEVEELINIAK